MKHWSAIGPNNSVFKSVFLKPFKSTFNGKYLNWLDGAMVGDTELLLADIRDVKSTSSSFSIMEPSVDINVNGVFQ